MTMMMRVDEDADADDDDGDDDDDDDDDCYRYYYCYKVISLFSISVILMMRIPKLEASWIRSDPLEVVAPRYESQTHLVLRRRGVACHWNHRIPDDHHQFLNISIILSS